MRSLTLSGDDCRALVTKAGHGVLGTVHPTRGVDAVPVVFVTDADDRLLLPIDAVKPKRGARLQRLVNIERDPRCVLLCDRYDDDWSRLWWVRVHGHATICEPAAVEHLAALAERYPQYREPGAITATIVLTPDRITGWTAGR